MAKVLQVTTFFTEMGGVEKSVQDLVSGLKYDHDVHVLCTHKSSRTKKEVSKGVLTTRVGSPLTLEGRPLALSFPFNLRQHDVEVVHYHLPFPLAMLSHLTMPPRSKVSVATWHHDMVRHPGLSKTIKPAAEAFLDRLDKIIVTAPQLIDHTPLLAARKDKCVVIPLGIDETRFVNKDHQTIAELRQKYGSPLILFVGRLVYYKGCEVLIKAMKSINANLVIIGEGPQQAELTNLAIEESVADRVHFVGRQPDEVLTDLYHACDLFVLPSTLSTECFGLVQVEAMMCGKPVVNTSLPTGVPWVSQHDETGLTVTPANHVELAAAINLLLDDDRLRTRLGVNAQRRANQMFTLTHHVKSVSDLYHQLLAPTKTRSAHSLKTSR